MGTVPYNERTKRRDFLRRNDGKGKSVTLLRSLAMAFSCFSQIPMPQIQWKPESMRFMMCFFPFIGMAVGLLVVGWAWLCGALGFGVLLQAAGYTLIPLCVTGGIHMDGFADTCDALASNSSAERRREILKDPHAGAFAVIGVGMYLLAYFAFATEFQPSMALVHLAIVPVLSRCLSGIATVSFPLSSGRGMLADEHESSDKRPVLVALVVLALACVAALLWFNLAIGIVMACIAAVSLAGLYVFSRNKFGGMSGDLAGFFLQMCELMLLIGIVVTCNVM